MITLGVLRKTLHSKSTHVRSLPHSYDLNQIYGNLNKIAELDAWTQGAQHEFSSTRKQLHIFLKGKISLPSFE